MRAQEIIRVFGLCLQTQPVDVVFANTTVGVALEVEHQNPTAKHPVTYIPLKTTAEEAERIRRELARLLIELVRKYAR